MYYGGNFLKISNTRQVSVHGVCPHDCYDTCGMAIEWKDGQIHRIQGQTDHPITQGFLCFKVNRYLERVHHRDRVLYPLKRTGVKGAGQFERVTWDDALQDIADRLGEVINRFGGEAILPYSFAGNMGVLSEASMDRRFFAAIGAANLDRTICTASASHVLRQMFGQRLGPDPEQIPQAQLIVLWGANPMATNVHQIPLLDQARKNGAKIWTIDPLATETAVRYHHHLPLIPNSDAILALAVGRYLIHHGLYDQNFIEQYTVGFKAYRDATEPWSLEMAARHCGISPTVIEELALDIAQVRPLLIRPGFGMQRQNNSGRAVWAVASLAVLTGSLRDSSGGLLLSNSDAFPLNWQGIQRPDLARHQSRTVNMVELGTALEDGSTHALIVYNANPAATAPEQAKVLRGLSRDDLFLVVHEQMMTDTARYADYVLPAALSMEILDLHVSYWHRYIQLNIPGGLPAGESVANTELFRRLAKAMKFGDPAFQESDADLIQTALNSDHPYLMGVTLQSLYENPVQKVRISDEARPFIDTPINTPDGRIHLEPIGGNRDFGGETGKYFLLTPSRRETIKSSFANLESFERRLPDPELLVNPLDAEAEAWHDGDWVKILNQRGTTRAKVCISPVPPRGTVVSYAVRWNHPGGGTNINQLTPGRVSDVGGGATFYSTRVDIIREGAADDVG
ncbi:MAG: trimethylamine-N-oxide reductase [Sulfobacillus benefaciens]|uniref:Trimethylamine-N-oxide reductase n=1 Tax=Sulfobacillus benefaciens TaxID=453960 RepID=A0A2T2XET5_9FIRM|nr:MAG: trimethylamine-N-oxide reductase [Sulfobacillus benefaciens]